MGLSIVVPVYNERDSIVDTIAELTGVINTISEPTELILVNDGSSDGSDEVLQREVARIEDGETAGHIQVVNHLRNSGYGASLKTGIAKAQYDTIAITDADSTYPNEELPRLLEHYREGYAMVVGMRSFTRLPLATRPAKWMLTRLANFLVGEKIPDINSGLRIFDRETAMRFFPMISDGFSFTTTITLAMLSSGRAVHYEPIQYKHRKGTS
ncbi:MAG: glycosyltransferase family 2 protein, partial [Alkalispirochaeta sp.]